MAMAIFENHPEQELPVPRSGEKVSPWSKQPSEEMLNPPSKMMSPQLTHRESLQHRPINSARKSSSTVTTPL